MEMWTEEGARRNTMVAIEQLMQAVQCLVVTGSNAVDRQSWGGDLSVLVADAARLYAKIWHEPADDPAP